MLRTGPDAAVSRPPPSWSARSGRDLREAADPARAPQMQAYMKSAMPYLGVPLPVTRRIARVGGRPAIRPPMSPTCSASATELWRSADLPRRALRRNRTHWTAAGRRAAGAAPLCREMIVTGAWWDHVDGVSHRIGAMLLAHPGELVPVIRRMVDRPGPLAPPEQHHLPAGSQGPHRQRTADRRDRAEPGGPGVLHPQGDRLGAAGLRPHRSGLGPGFVVDHDAVISPLSRREAIEASRLNPGRAGDVLWRTAPTPSG